MDDFSLRFDRLADVAKYNWDKSSGLWQRGSEAIRFTWKRGQMARDRHLQPLLLGWKRWRNAMRPPSHRTHGGGRSWRSLCWRDRKRHFHF